MINKLLKLMDGFSLIEGLIAVFFTMIIAISVAGMITNFALFTSKDNILTCLVQGASSGIEFKRANPSSTSMQIQCGTRTVNVSMTGNPPANAPQIGSGQSACAEIVSTATIGSNQKTLKDWVCTLTP
ncbi:MAG: hypothetical protein N2738_07380 [Thermodesulfovibrionales bacterium]|nr:hypothetical protein [Thermodesulfovibrionales bacterium]